MPRSPYARLSRTRPKPIKPPLYRDVCRRALELPSVEAAGFVLGAIPLVISALKHSAKGVETI